MLDTRTSTSYQKSFNRNLLDLCQFANAWCTLPLPHRYKSPVETGSTRSKQFFNQWTIENGNFREGGEFYLTE